MNLRFSLSIALFSLSFSGCVLLLPFVDTNREPPLDSPFGEVRARGSYGNSIMPPSNYQTDYALKERKPARISSRRPDRVTSLLAQLEDPNAAKRTSAATDLARLQPAETDRAVPLLVSRLQNDESKWVRRACARTLGVLGGESAEQALQKARRDRDPYVAHTAKNSLRALQQKN